MPPYRLRHTICSGNGSSCNGCICKVCFFGTMSSRNKKGHAPLQNATCNGNYSSCSGCIYKVCFLCTMSSRDKKGHPPTGWGNLPAGACNYSFTAMGAYTYIDMCIYIYSLVSLPLAGGCLAHGVRGQFSSSVCKVFLGLCSIQEDLLFGRGWIHKGSFQNERVHAPCAMGCCLVSSATMCGSYVCLLALLHVLSFGKEWRCCFLVHTFYGLFLHRTHTFAAGTLWSFYSY